MWHDTTNHFSQSRAKPPIWTQCEVNQSYIDFSKLSAMKEQGKKDYAVAAKYLNSVHISRKFKKILT